MRMPDREPGRFDLARIGGINRTRRDIVARDPLKIAGASSRLSQVAEWLETAGGALGGPLQAAKVGQDIPKSTDGKSEPKKPVENLYARPMQRCQEAIKFARGIPDYELRTDVLFQVAKAGIEGHLPGVAADAYWAMHEGSYVGYVIPAAFKNAAKVQRELGRYSVAERDLKEGSVTPDAQWYLDTAIRKGVDWKRGKEVDPVPDLEKARELLLTPGIPLKLQGVQDLAMYVKAHFQAIGILPNDTYTNKSILTTAEESFRGVLALPESRFGDYFSFERISKFAVKNLSPLVDAYCTVGKPAQALQIIEDIPATADMGVVKAKVEALARITTGSYDDVGWIDRGLSGEEAVARLEVADRAAEKAIKEIDNMPDGAEKDELLQTVGVEMYVQRADHTAGFDVDTLRSKALEIVEATTDPFRKAEGYKRLAPSHNTEKARAFLEQARRVLDTVWWAQKPDAKTAVKLAAGYRSLVGELADQRLLPEAEEIAQTMLRFLDKGEATAFYVEAQADIAWAEGMEVPRSALIDKYIRGSISHWEGNWRDVCLDRTGVPVWCVVGAYGDIGSVTETARGFELFEDEVNAALAFNEAHGEKIGPIFLEY